MRNLALTAERSGAENVSDERLDPVKKAHELAARRKANLLFVDADDFLVEMIESGLAVSRPRWQVVTTRHPAEALGVLERSAEHDAIVTEIVFEQSAEVGKAFIREAGHRWPEIPIFVMTRLDPEEMRGLDTAEHIAKPPDMDFLISRVDRAIRRQRESLVRGISLPTFLQIMELEQKTCTVIVSHGGRVGEVCFRKGILMQARLEGIEGEEALFGMLSMPEHSLRVVDTCDAGRKIPASLASLLMDWSIRQDHAQRGGPALHEEDD